MPAERPHNVKMSSPSLRKLIDYATNLNPHYDDQVYCSHSTTFAAHTEKVYAEIEHFHSMFSEMPFLSFIVLWANSMERDRVFGERYISMINDLVQKNLIPYWDFKFNRPLHVEEARNINHETVIDNIRCYKDWSLDKREDYVTFYCEFANWASETSFGYFGKAIDPDRQITLRRRLPYDSYVRILKELSDRDRILAKIFYLGGSRSLEEVLSLEIENIDFQKNTLSFSQEAISYPRHVLEDIKEYVGNRKSGYVFLSRQGERIVHTVPYRALKTVVSKLDFDPSFTFKDFVKNV